MVKKETAADMAHRLMNNREFIRNIGIVAHIDHGKCVAPQTRLVLADGRIATAERLFEETAEKGQKVKEDENEAIFDISAQKVSVNTLNKESGKIEQKAISHVWKLKGGKTVEIKLRNGFIAETTPEHKYIVWKNSKFIEKEARNLVIGAHIACIKNFEGITQLVSNSNGTVSVTKNLELIFSEVASISEGFQEVVYDFTVPETHNFVAEGMVIHNTTMTDSLIAAAGLISPDLAGKLQYMDYEDQEKARGITINAANISLTYEYKGQPYLINLIDTPGHVDFTAEVIRAMRAVDGVVLVVDAVEGVMPQTETVCRQALREFVRPVLYINKIDRLVNELQLTAEQMQERFVKVIMAVNQLIKRYAPEQFKDKWLVSVEDGTVAFGSAYNRWGVSIHRMKENGVTFKDVFEFCKNNDQKSLAAKSPLHATVLEMVILKSPNPLQSQKYRIPKIWKGEPESELGKSMLNSDEKGPLAMMVTDVSVHPQAGDIATGRVYSGTVTPGKKVRLLGMQKDANIQKVGIFMGPDFVDVANVQCGNIASIIGLKEAFAGETIAENADVQTFEEFMSTAEPVVTVSIEAKNTKDLPKLIEVLRRLTKEDPSLTASINQETGEHLLSGMGELHLEINQYRIEKRHGVPITVSTPIVVYHETCTKKSPVLESKSPNRHNKFKLIVEPLSTEMMQKLIEGRFEGKVREKDKTIVDRLIDVGFDRDEAKKIWAIHNHSVLLDATRGIVALHEIKELVIQAFFDAMNEGPLAKEKCDGLLVTLDDATLHEDAIHRGPSQVLPAMTRGIYACMLSGDAILLEPKQLLTINVPENYMGSVSKELGARRTQIKEMRIEGDLAIIIGRAPVKELIGFSQSMRSATQGRAVWTGEYAGYEPMPKELQKSVVAEVRKRKGMDPEVKPAAFFLE